MKKGKRFVSVVVAAIMSAAVVLTVAGCGKEKVDTETHIEIYAYKAGYGIEWIQAIADAFIEKKAEEGVTVTFDIWGDTYGQQDTLLRSGPKHNMIDLFVVTGSVADIVEEGPEVVSGYDVAIEPLDDVFASDVEGTKFEDKIINYYTPNKIKGQYYQMSWVGGISGLIYNKTLFDTIGISAPKTTKELLDACTTIKTTDKVPQKNRVPFVFSASTGYFEYLRDMWWMQYEGPEGIRDFFNCIDDGMLSKEIFLQEGRLKALETLESLVGYNTGNINPSVSSYSFTQAQTQLILGEGLMQANGDWLEHEMRSVAAQDSNKYDFRIMRTPVISSIIDRCKDIKDEATLRKVVAAVDSELDGDTPDKSGIAGVGDADYNRILEARKVSWSTGAGSTMYIPAYATAKDMAKEFMTFMATDEAIRLYIDSTSGNQPPFKYDLPSDTERWNKLSNFQKDNYYNKQKAVFFQAFNGGPFPLSYTGDRNNSEIYFAAPNAADRRTASQLFRGEYDSWSDAKWQQLLREKGLI